MGISETVTRSARSQEAGRQERLASSAIIQSGRAVRYKAAGKRYATITRSLQRPDPTTEPATEAITCYKVKLDAEAAFDAWDVEHEDDYGVDEKVLASDGLDYQCDVKHAAAEDKEPGTGEDWEDYWSCISLDAYILGYPYTDLIGTVPWYKVESEVEVVKRDDVYYIHGTVNRCEEIDSQTGELFTSIQWNVTDQRVMAVYE